jgi:hypothetical protein
LIGVLVPDCAPATVGLTSDPANISEANDVATSFCINAPFEAAGFTTAIQH